MFLDLIFPILEKLEKIECIFFYFGAYFHIVTENHDIKKCFATC
jgi:hypothetical protein